MSTAGRSPEEREFRKGEIEDVVVWVALLVLLALTMGVGFADWGAWSTALSFLIAAVKAALIAWFYMHLKNEKGMTRVFALAGVAWLVVLFSLTLSDYVSRSWLPYPSRWPIFIKLRPSLNGANTEDQEKAPRPGGFGVGR